MIRGLVIFYAILIINLYQRTKNMLKWISGVFVEDLYRIFTTNSQLKTYFQDEDIKSEVKMETKESKGEEEDEENKKTLKGEINVIKEVEEKMELGEQNGDKEVNYKKIDGIDVKVWQIISRAYILQNNFGNDFVVQPPPPSPPPSPKNFETSSKFTLWGTHTRSPNPQICV